MKLARYLLLLCLSAVLGCGGSASPAPGAPRAPLPASDGYLAGVASADITPPLHLSLFGHGPEGRVATGVRLRLGCQVFVLAWHDQPLALVPCELQSSSMTLHRGIAARLAQAGIPIPIERIYVMATHTHAAPGHYFESRRFSGPFSSIAPGYDEKVRDFLVERIGDAIVRAYKQVKPVCLGWARTEVDGLSFNRSYAPFLSNRRRGEHGTAAGVLQQASGRRVAEDDSEDEEFRRGSQWAVDPSLFVLRIDEREPGATVCTAAGPPLGVLGIFGMHPTAVANTNELYHGDVFGFAHRFAQACLQDAKPPEAAVGSKLDLPMTGEARPRLACDSRFEVRSQQGLEGLAPPKPPMVGLANGIEGDVSPRVDVQSVNSARQLGRELGGRIATLAADIAQMHVAPGPGRSFRARYWELPLPEAPFSDDRGAGVLCKHPELGIASAGGAQDGPTLLRVIPEANAGFRLGEPDKNPCHGRKLPLRVGLGRDKHDFPQRAAIGLLEVDGLYLATVPAEPTTMVGLRIRDQVTEHIVPALRVPGEAEVTIDQAAKHVAVVGLTNHWIEYLTTEEEYEYQYYEGASNLYGPNSARFFSSHFDCLTQVLIRNSTALPCVGQKVIDKAAKHVAFDPYPQVDRLPDSESDHKVLMIEEPEVFVTRSNGDVGWGITFPRLPVNFIADRHKFRVVIRAEDNGVIEDDRGASIEIREVDDGDRWRVRWSPDLQSPEDPLCDRFYRIAVLGRQPITSRRFRLECSRFMPGGAQR